MSNSFIYSNLVAYTAFFACYIVMLIEGVNVDCSKICVVRKDENLPFDYEGAGMDKDQIRDKVNNDKDFVDVSDVLFYQLKFGAAATGLYMLTQWLGACGLVCKRESMLIVRNCSGLIVGILLGVQLILAMLAADSKEANACLAENFSEDLPDATKIKLAGYAININVIHILRWVSIL